MTKIQQVSVRKVTLQTIMSRKPFMKGFQEAHSGKGFDYDAYTNPVEQWGYERGRIFGIVYHGKLKDGQRVTIEAKRAYHELIKEGSIL